VQKLIRDQRGATLIEVLIAVGIIGVGLWALSAVIPLAAYGIHEGSHLSTATFLANQRLEQVRNARWEAGQLPQPLCGVLDYGVDSLGVSASSTAAPVGSCVGGGTTFPDENPVVPIPTPINAQLNPYAGYTRTVRITSCGVGAGCNGIVDNDLRQVAVTVTYRPMTGTGLSAAGTAKASTVTMYVARR
jgi:prepilin-type N-terminal cleavage/methylation domain-containing protein